MHRDRRKTPRDVAALKKEVAAEAGEIFNPERKVDFEVFLELELSARRSEPSSKDLWCRWRSTASILTLTILPRDTKLGRNADRDVQVGGVLIDHRFEQSGQTDFCHLHSPS